MKHSMGKKTRNAGRSALLVPTIFLIALFAAPTAIGIAGTDRTDNSAATAPEAVLADPGGVTARDIPLDTSKPPAVGPGPQPRVPGPPEFEGSPTIAPGPEPKVPAPDPPNPPDPPDDPSDPTDGSQDADPVDGQSAAIAPVTSAPQPASDSSTKRKKKRSKNGSSGGKKKRSSGSNDSSDAGSNDSSSGSSGVGTGSGTDLSSVAPGSIHALTLNLTTVGIDHGTVNVIDRSGLLRKLVVGFKGAVRPATEIKEVKASFLRKTDSGCFLAYPGAPEGARSVSCNGFADRGRLRTEEVGDTLRFAFRPLAEPGGPHSAETKRLLKDDPQGDFLEDGTYILTVKVVSHGGAAELFRYRLQVR